MIIDIVLVVFVLLMAIIGLRQGFMKMLLSLLGTIATIIAVVLLAESFANFLSGFIPFDRWIGVPIENWIGGIGSIATTPVPETSAEMSQILNTQMGIPGFIANMIGPWLFKLIPADMIGLTAANVISTALLRVIVIAIAGILLFILIRIAVGILQRLFKKLAQVQFIGAIDRTFGLVLGVAKAYFFVLIIFTAMSAMMAFSFMKPVADQLEQSTVSKWIYDNNFIAHWLFGNPKDTAPEDGEDSQNPPENEGETETALLAPPLYTFDITDKIQIGKDVYALRL